MAPSPTPFHQLISFRLADSLGRTIVRAGLGLVLTAPLFTMYRLDGGRYGLPLGWLLVAVVLTLVYAVLWRRFVGRGPLERVVARVSRPWSAPVDPVPDSRA